MRRLVVLLTISAAFGALGAVACGGSEKPPLTPDSETKTTTETTTTTTVSDGGAADMPSAQ